MNVVRQGKWGSEIRHNEWRMEDENGTMVLTHCLERPAEAGWSAVGRHREWWLAEGENDSLWLRCSGDFLPCDKAWNVLLICSGGLYRCNGVGRDSYLPKLEITDDGKVVVQTQAAGWESKNEVESPRVKTEAQDREWWLEYRDGFLALKCSGKPYGDGAWEVLTLFDGEIYMCGGIQSDAHLPALELTDNGEVVIAG